MPTRTRITVAPKSDGGWAVMAGRNTLSSHRKKDAAVAAGRKQAKSRAPSQLTIKGGNGKIQDQSSYEASAKPSPSRPIKSRAGSSRKKTAARRPASGTKSQTASGRRKTGGPTQRTRQTVADIMTPDPRTLSMSASLQEAAATMRTADAGTVLISDEQGRLTGILTDRDIAIRGVADGLDPLSTKVADISSPYPDTISPQTSVAEAFQLMRKLDVRRLPVSEGDRAVGIVSLGDLAIMQDPSSVLADISSSPSTDRPSGTVRSEDSEALGVTVVEEDVVSLPEIDMAAEGRR
jgi:CBS domain-containing protein